MVITLEPGADCKPLLEQVRNLVHPFQGITLRVHEFQGASQSVAEIHLIGETRQVPTELFTSLQGVRGVVRVSVKYRLIGRPAGSAEPAGFDYNGVRFGNGEVKVFAGLCAVDSREHVE